MSVSRRFLQSTSSPTAGDEAWLQKLVQLPKGGSAGRHTTQNAEMKEGRNLTQGIHNGLNSLGTNLQTHEGRIAILCGCIGLLKRLLRWTCLAYFVILISICVLMRFVGEQNVFFAFCVYLPPLVWHLPTFVLLPACALLLEWRGFVLGIAGACISLICFFGYEMPWKNDFNSKVGKNQENNLVVLTNNRGQNAGQSMRAFKNDVAPDVMLFQESGSYSARYLADPGYSEFQHGKDVGEFTVLSKYPILSVRPLTVRVRSVQRVPSPTAAPLATPEESIVVAGRFVIDFQGRPVVLYNVHLPSPRDTLRYHMRGAFLYGLIGIPGTSLSAKRAAIQLGWNQRIEIVSGLLKLANEEVDPTILAGDFNMPSVGYCHGLVSDHYRDAHEDGGSGFGFTFPGISGNPLWLGGPGLRIDYVFFDPKHWKCVGSLAEPDRESQHRASVARLTLTELE